MVNKSELPPQYRIKDGKLYKKESQNAIKMDGFANMEHDLSTPTETDRLNTLYYLMDFTVVNPPKDGVLLGDLVPEFETRHELFRWRQSRVFDHLDSC